MVSRLIRRVGIGPSFKIRNLIVLYFGVESPFITRKLVVLLMLVTEVLIGDENISLQFVASSCRTTTASWCDPDVCILSLGCGCL